MTNGKKVLLRDIVITVATVVLLALMVAGKLSPYIYSRIVGMAALLGGIYYVQHAFRQKEHSNLFLRLKGDERKIPTTTGHRILTAGLACGMIVCGLVLLSIGLNH